MCLCMVLNNYSVAYKDGPVSENCLTNSQPLMNTVAGKSHPEDNGDNRRSEKYNMNKKVAVQQPIVSSAVSFFPCLHPPHQEMI